MPAPGAAWTEKPKTKLPLAADSMNSGTVFSGAVSGVLPLVQSHWSQRNPPKTTAGAARMTFSSSGDSQT
ncbi:MAG: hypothetical protein IPM79_31885 [Polyangiaceae bacterium]|nr:hypothetical protein [Polyangiaceae bacterium]